MAKPWENCRKGGKMDKVIMLSNLLEFNEIMSRNSIPFFFIFGTLLGAKREDDFIEYDTDVDVGAFLEDRERIEDVINELRLRGFIAVPTEECPPNDNFFIRGDEKIEIWWFEEKGNERVYDYNIRYNKSFFEPLNVIDFQGEEFYTPNNSEEFLEITYGDWRTPDPKGTYILGRK